MKLIKKNKKAFFDYEILDELNAGISLTGSEVKSIKAGNISLTGSFLKFYGENLFLVNMFVGKYKPAGEHNHEPERNRQLLLQKKELVRLFNKSQIKGNTLIALELYEDRSLIKVKIAIAKGKKKYEKKEIIKNRQLDREIGRKLKNLGK